MSTPDALAKPLAIVGAEDIVIGFRALGFDVYPVGKREEFRDALNEAAKKGYAVCLVQEDIYKAEEARINNYRTMPMPVFIPFGRDSSTAFFDAMIKAIRLRATGAL